MLEFPIERPRLPTVMRARQHLPSSSWYALSAMVGYATCLTFSPIADGGDILLISLNCAPRGPPLSVYDKRLLAVYATSSVRLCEHRCSSRYPHIVNFSCSSFSSYAAHTLHYNFIRSFPRARHRQRPQTTHIAPRDRAVRPRRLDHLVNKSSRVRIQPLPKPRGAALRRSISDTPTITGTVDGRRVSDAGLRAEQQLACSRLGAGPLWLSEGSPLSNRWAAQQSSA
ncbi:hypothetical protein ONZ51_g6073 [Trametes cubensis]|uniref:Uncharacterized protein n=1 Tax=Trametes cubensis TaxID=1111947 RepID=A0AAD7XAC4_9APHY|nr:hypothetical protein ONZ51_g6073 [Trametes cubensis]